MFGVRLFALSDGPNILRSPEQIVRGKDENMRLESHQTKTLKRLP